MAISKNVSAITLSAAAAALLVFTGCGGGGGGTGGGTSSSSEETSSSSSSISSTSSSSSSSAPTASCLDGNVLSGDCETDVYLSKAGSPYEIDGLVKVKNGATITIEAGTKLYGDEQGEDYLVVTRGSKIIANGTADEHIVFTSKTALNDQSLGDVSQCGGLTILGAAPTNHADPHYEVNEQDPDFAFGNAEAGKGNAADNSGVLRYVDVLNSGITVGTDQEINGLSLAGVGSSTIVEHITVENSSDDCIEIWGGTVNVSHATLTNCQDDSFDLDYGYVGHAMDITVVQVESAHAGFEISSGGTTPMTGATIKDFTITKVNGSDEGGIYIKDDSTAPIFINGVVTTVGADDAAIHTKKAFAADQKAQIAFKDVTLSAAVNFDGAGAADAEERYNADDASEMTVDTTTLSADITANTHLTADKMYKIDGLVKVKNGATLTIDAGTTIFGDESGSDYIVVTKGSKINAAGTPEAPIVFTSEKALMQGESGVSQWGGLTVLGAAPTNHDDPHYEIDEQDPDFAFGNAVAGAGDANDNSGALTNVVIANSGITIGTDQEINGLSLAGVGAGTTVQNITVINSSDDCIEIWGGTVDVATADLTNCQDDSFDLDYGYVGTATDIRVTQVEAAHAGFEISSGGTNPMTGARIENFSITKVAGSDEGGIYIKDDSTAPIFVTGSVVVDATDVAIHTKKAFAADQKAQIAFKNVTLDPETFDGAGAVDAQERWEANDAQ